MESPNVPLFTPAGLAVLNRRVYDPTAKASYELMSGGLIWADEFPEFGSEEFRVMAPGFAYRKLVAYRADLTLGEERIEFRPVWEQVVRFAPDWPGLRPERRGERARQRLMAAKRREARCLEELERQLEPRRGDGR
ncbi:MAG TPA: hypothetical protein VKE74_04160 [Gemmataceae bacterium]|nr:hypothetical protein [Gemmataceae bacterium]